MQFNITLCVRLQNTLRMWKNWRYRVQAICSLRTKAGFTHSYCCVVRLPACYFWLAFCYPYQCLAVNSTPVDRCQLYLPLYPLYLSSGAFTRLRKNNINFVGSVCPSIRPSVRLEKFGCLWKYVILMNFDIWKRFENLRKFQTWLEVWEE